jgi:hypothetical protein
MKNRKHTALLVILTVLTATAITFALVGCPQEDNGDGIGPITTSPVFSDIDDVRSWLEKQPANASYKIILKIDDVNNFTKIRATIRNNPDKYIYLDLSGSYAASIPNSAFVDCATLKEITIHNNVSSIGAGAFSGCTGLTSITIPNGVTLIDDYAFNLCTNLTSVTFGRGNTRLGNSWVGGSGSGGSYSRPAYPPFGGDLYQKYQSGGAGTYTTTAPVSDSSVWTKQ